jgi:HEAT repeat protein
LEWTVPKLFAMNRIAAATAALCLLAGAVRADEPKKENVERLKDFMHFVLIDAPDKAKLLGEQLVAEKMSDTDFVDLVEKTQRASDFDNVMAHAVRYPDLEPTAAKLLRKFEAGKLARVRDPGEIAKYIAMLSGTQRGRILAQQRLEAAGEYAMPQLLSAMLQRADVALSAEVSRLMIGMGRQSVIPLCTALPKLDPVGQEQSVNVLGSIPYRASLPFLFELSGTTKSEPVRKACQRAISRIGGGGTEDPAGLYLQLAQDYYAEKTELTSFPGEANQLIWSFNPGSGLFPQAIATPVFHEAMAMRLTEHSLTLRKENPEALALWVASNLRREIETPEGYENPAYGKDRRDAMYYAVAAGAETDQRVLANGIDTRNTPLIRRAIASIEKTAGGSSLWAGNRKPLLEALRYPNRRVQYEAALALAAAQPTAPFNGSERVVPLLASAVRDSGASYAVVLGSDNERYQGYRKILEKQGYTVLPFGRQLADVDAAIAEMPGIDLIVSALPTESTAKSIEEIRSRANLGATPILALAVPQGDLDLGRKFAHDPTIMVRPPGLAEEQVVAAMQELVRTAAGGPVTATEARSYATRALAALRDLAISGSSVFNVEDAALPLMGVLGNTTGEVRMQVAEVLGRINQKRCQVALMDAAMGEKAENRIALLGKVADSAKRYGNQLETRQVKRLVELAGSGSDQEATAAASVMGALNLPNTDLIPLITQQQTKKG